MATKRYVWKDARPLTWLMTGMMGARLIVLLPLTVFEAAMVLGVAPADATAVGVIQVGAVVSIGFMAIALTFGLFWGLRVSRNAHASGIRMEHSPAATIWWYIVPLASLVMPMIVMAEIWTTSGGSRGYGLVKAWWATLIIATLLSLPIRLDVGGLGLIVVEEFATIVSTAIFILMAHKLARLQTQPTEIADVFGDEPARPARSVLERL